MDLFVGWSLYKNLDMNGGKLSFGGIDLSNEASAAIFATYLNKLQTNANSYSLSTDATKKGIYDFSQSDFKTILGAVSDAHNWFNYKLGKGPNPFNGGATNADGYKQLTANGGKLFVINPKEEVMDVFDMTGFSSFLNIEER